MRAVLYRGARNSCKGCPYSSAGLCDAPKPDGAPWRDGPDVLAGPVADCHPRSRILADWTPVELAAVASGLVPYVLREDADPTPAGLSGEGENNDD